ncbi:unnamed protein product [Heligmosomoides polygyrus]|uniref:RDD family protein n=1 Tax=Heligmosomoides polygyrus TaxID=6339 RepID=A0A183FHC1_HELPZ|nr:unnamed protein product [Heligmosomoides polygyrus]
MVFTIAFSVIFLYYRYIMNKTGGFSLKVSRIPSRTALKTQNGA